MSAVYSNHKQSPFEHFRPLASIEGQPGLEAMSTGTPADGECSVDVGLRDDQIITVGVISDADSPLAQDPCVWAAKIAGMAVQTMKQGG